MCANAKLSLLLQDWQSYEEFSDIAESNIFLSSQEADAAQQILEGTLALRPDAEHCPKASDNEDEDVTILLEVSVG